MNPPPSISDSLANAEWEELANMLRIVSTGVEGNDAQAKRLKAKLGLIRMLMYQEISGWNGDNSIELSYFIASFKTIQKVEKELSARGVKKSEFLTFLKLLFYKFQKQRLKAKKPFALLSEFGKLKEVVENGHSPI